MFIFITIISPYCRSRGSGPGLKRVGGGSNLAMSSLSLPPGRAKTSEDETNNKIKINIPICRLGGAAKSEDVGSEGGRRAAEQDGQLGEDDHRGGEAERQR